MSDQFRPTARTGVSVRNQRNRQRPGDGEVGIVVGDRQVFRRVMGPVDPVAHVRSVRQSLEPVEKTRWDIKMPKNPVVQQECLLPTKSRRVRSDVDQYVVYRPVCAADEFGLTTAGAAVQAPDHPSRRTGLRILHKPRRYTGRPDNAVEDLRVKGTGEEAAVVVERMRYEDHDIGQFGLLDIHPEMLS